MRKTLLLVVMPLLFLSCNAQTPTAFSKEALQDNFMALNGDSVTLKSILEAHKDQTIVIDIWASWCGDCIKGLPKLKALQKEYPKAAYVFLSLDKKQSSWKKGIEKYQIKGSHYYVTSGWDGAFGSFIDLDWIPRYMIVDSKGNIKYFKAINANDNKLKKALKATTN